MSDLSKFPSGWAMATLPELAGTVGLFVDGDWVESKDQDPAGDVRLVQLADIGDGCFNNRSARFLTSEKAAELRCTFLQTGDVMIARMPDPLGRSCIFPGDIKKCVTVVDVCMMRAPLVSHKWLMWTINSPDFRMLIASEQRGSTRKRISRSSLGALPLPIPPRAEQDRIVAAIEQHLSDVDAGVAALERILANLKRYRASVLKAACEGRLVPTEAELARKEGRTYESADVLLQRILKERRARWEADQLAKMKAKGQEPRDDKWKAKYEEPKGPETNGLPELPEGWQYARAEQLCDFITKGTTPSGNDAPTSAGDVPFIKVQHLGFDGRLNFEVNPSFVGRDVHNNFLARSIVYPGDVLMNIVGPPLGQVAIVPITFAEWNMNQAVAVYRSVPPLTAKYLSIVLRSENIQRRAIARAKATAGQVNLTLEICRDICIPLSPLAEQHRIVAEVERLLSVADETEALVRTQLARAERLRQSILKRAFEGKLVPQDPNDEPASALLERIRTASTADKPAARAKKKARPTKAP